jgi:hypothetical protein
LSTVATSGKYADLIDGYTLPTATDKILGAIKVGKGLTITGDVLSASGTTATDASTTAKGVVQLADPAAIKAGTSGLVVDAAELKAGLDLKAPLASPSFTGVVSLPLGAATMPSLAFTGDVDTGLFLKAANTPVIVAGGVESLVVTSTGVSIPGNITSTGKAHTFEAGSIKRAAIDGIDETTLDARYVNVDGDTMTGVLKVAPTKTGTAPHGSIAIVGESQQAHLSVERYSDAPAAGPIHRFYRMRGTETAPQTVKAGDNLGQIIFHTKRGDGLTGNAVRISAACLEDPPATPGLEPQVSLSLQVSGIVGGTPQLTILREGMGLNWTTPTHPLEVGGNSMLRGTLDVAGNITSTGTAHSFVAKSIPRSAVDGIDEATLDTRYVNVDGDTMTGPLTIRSKTAPAAPAGVLTIDGDTTSATFTIHRNTDTNTSPLFRMMRARGSLAAPMPVKAGDIIAQIVSSSVRTNGTMLNGANIQVICTHDVDAQTSLPSKLVFNVGSVSGTAAKALAATAEGVGVMWETPTSPLEVGGNSKLRGDLDVVGNITSTGAAHSFVANSIPSSAIDGLISSAIPKKTPASQTATGTAGEFCWDANYLYGCIAANDWRRIPWTDWHGNTLPGSGAGATDTALAAPKTNATAMVKATAADNPKSAMVGKIIIKLMEALPALSTGVKVQYRIHGGNWVDATVLEYSTADTSPLFATWDALKKSTAPLTTARCVTISGPPPGTPYLTRIAFTSSLGVGAWSDELTAVTPTA